MDIHYELKTKKINIKYLTILVKVYSDNMSAKIKNFFSLMVSRLRHFLKINKIWRVMSNRCFASQWSKLTKLIVWEKDFFVQPTTHIWYALTMPSAIQLLQWQTEAHFVQLELSATWAVTKFVILVKFNTNRRWYQTIIDSIDFSYYNRLRRKRFLVSIYQQLSAVREPTWWQFENNNNWNTLLSSWNLLRW